MCELAPSVLSPLYSGRLDWLMALVVSDTDGIRSHAARVVGTAALALPLSADGDAASATKLLQDLVTLAERHDSSARGVHVQHGAVACIGRVVACIISRALAASPTPATTVAADTAADASASSGGGAAAGGGGASPATSAVTSAEQSTLLQLASRGIATLARALLNPLHAIKEAAAESVAAMCRAGSLPVPEGAADEAVATVRRFAAAFPLSTIGCFRSNVSCAVCRV